MSAPASAPASPALAAPADVSSAKRAVISLLSEDEDDEPTPGPARTSEAPAKRVKLEPTEEMAVGAGKAGSGLQEEDSDIEVVSRSPAKPSAPARSLRRSTSDESLPSVEADVRAAVVEAAKKVVQSPKRAAPVAETSIRPKPVQPRPSLTPKASATPRQPVASASRSRPSPKSAARPTWSLASPTRRREDEEDVDELREDTPAPRPMSRPAPSNLPRPPSPRKRKPLPVTQAATSVFEDPMDRPPSTASPSLIDDVIATVIRREKLQLRPAPSAVPAPTFFASLAQAVAADKTWQVPLAPVAPVAMPAEGADRRLARGVPAGPKLDRPPPRSATAPEPVKADSAVVRVTAVEPGRPRRRVRPGEIVLSDDSDEEERRDPMLRAEIMRRAKSGPGHASWLTGPERHQEFDWTLPVHMMQLTAELLDDAQWRLYREIFQTWINEPNAPPIRVISLPGKHPQRRSTQQRRPATTAAPEFNFMYTNRLVYREGVAGTSQSDGCNCRGVCSPDDPTCACAIRQRPHNARVGTDASFAYDAAGLLAGEEVPPIFECNAKCACGPDCMNRVVGRGRTAQIDIALTPNCGWGLFAAADGPGIASGSFITTYSGEVLQRSEGVTREDVYNKVSELTYLFDLDGQGVAAHATRFEENGFACLDDVDQDPSQHVQGYESAYSVDAYHLGNLSRLANHSCVPCAMVCNVYIDERDRSKPILAFFASRDIQPGEEITISYSGNIPSEQEIEAALSRQKTNGKTRQHARPTPTTAGLPTPNQSDDDHALKVCRCGHPACYGYVFRTVTSDESDG